MNISLAKQLAAVGGNRSDWTHVFFKNEIHSISLAKQLTGIEVTGHMF